jgi:gliding motility-associated-like protein
MNILIVRLLKKKIFFAIFLICFLVITKNNVSAQFVQIESILVDACDEGTGDEGLNEMVRFRVESVPVNVADIRVDGINTTGTPGANQWPTLNAFLGWITLTPGTAAYDTAVAKVTRINASIVNCGKLIIPTGGTSNQGLIPAGKKGLVITSYKFLPFANDFSLLTDTLYVVFQNNPSTTSGNFTNYGAAGTRKLRFHQISTGTNEDVQYDKSLLIDQTGASAAQDGAGVRYTDAGVATYYNDGCQAPYIPLSPDWTAPAAMCPTASAVNLSSLVTGTAGGTWSGTGVTGTSFNPSGLNGTYSITYTVGISPCQLTQSHDIQVISAANASWTPPSSLCQSSAALNLNTLLAGTATTGGTWSGTGATGNTFNPSGLSGNINVTYTVGTAPCIATESHTIQVITLAIATWTAPSPLCQSSAALNLNTLLAGTATTGGTWSGTGVTGNTFTPSGLSGNITITYTVGTAPCTATESHAIQVIASSIATWTAPSPLCQSSAALNLNTLLAGTATTGGTWSGTGVTGTTFNPSGLSGNITVTYTVGTAPCTTNESHSIQVITLAIATWTAPSPLCQSSATLNLNTLLAGTATTGGTWSGTGVTGNTFNPSGLSGNINITYTVGTAPCTATESHTIQVIASSIATWTAPSPLCQSSAALNLNSLLAGTATTGGTWSGTGVTGSTFNPSGLSGNINVTYTVGTSPCTATESHTIQVITLAIPTWTAPSPLCQSSAALNLNTLLAGTATTGGIWLGTGVTGNTFNPSGLSGNITITYTVGTAPCTATESHAIQVIASSIATWTAPSALCQSSAALNLNTLLAGTATTGGTWSGNGVTGNIFNPLGLSGNITVTYTVGTVPCTATESHDIQVIASSIATWTAPSALCQSASFFNLNSLLAGTATTGGIWSGIGVTGNLFNPSGLNGNITITYTVGTVPCAASESHDIQVMPNYDASWTPPTSICADASAIDLSALITGDPGGTWTGQGVVLSQFNPAGLTGNIPISYIVSGANGCPDTVTHTISITPIPSAAWVAPVVVCKNQISFNLNSMITGTQGGQWSGTGVTSNILNLNNLGDSLAVTYTVNTNGCISAQTGMLHFSYVNADFTMTPSYGFAPLNVVTTNLSQNAVTYHWDFSNGNTSTDENPSSIFLYEGTYPVWLVATSALGCVDSLYKDVIIEESGDYIPNAITHDGDNLNDQFFPVITKLVTNYQMMIFDRWGNMIFETTDQSGKWDATYKGQPVPIGVYVYVISYEYRGKLIYYHGIVTVLV